MERDQANELVRRMAQAWMRADIPAIVELFTTDGVFASPGGAARGQEAIAAVAEAFFRQVVAVQVDVQRVLVDGNRGVVEWTWRETARGATEDRSMEDAIVFEVRDGKLCFWREYFDPGQTQPLQLPSRQA